MSDEATPDLVAFERRVRALMEELVTSHPEIVAACRPGINLRPVEGDHFEAYMVRLDGGEEVIGTFPAKWLRVVKG